MRSNVACNLKEVFCGRRCGREMACGLHTCPRPCHSGPCISVAEEQAINDAKHGAEVAARDQATVQVLNMRRATKSRSASQGSDTEPELSGPAAHSTVDGTSAGAGSHVPFTPDEMAFIEGAATAARAACRLPCGQVCMPFFFAD